MYVYELAIQTILLCFCEDYKVHNIGEAGCEELHREAYMSQSLRRIVLPADEYQKMKRPMTIEEVEALGKPPKNFNKEKVLSANEILIRTTQILRNSEEYLHQQIRLEKLGNKQLLLRAGGPELWDRYNDARDGNGISYTKLVDIIYRHSKETNGLQTSKSALTQEAIDSYYDQKFAGLSTQVKEVQHGRYDSKFAKERSVKAVTLQSIHRKMSKRPGSSPSPAAKVNSHAPRESGTPKSGSGAPNSGSGAPNNIYPDLP